MTDMEYIADGINNRPVEEGSSHTCKRFSELDRPYISD